jgi:TP901 family phage tail tape measure protein
VGLRTVGVKLTADISQYTSALARAGAATKDFTGKLDQSAKAGKLDKVADTAGVAGIALAGMAGYAIKAAADFDKAMSGVQAATHASAKDIGALRQAALQAGKDTQYSATQAAQGITELSKAGVSTADVLGGGLKGALSLAAAGQIDVGEAAETAASAMTQFGLSGKDIPHVADLLAAAAGKAQGSVHDMGYALSQSGLVASQFGLSIEDTTGTLAAFASAGLIGSDAGTSFKTMLLALANPAVKTKDAMDELGISAYDAQGKFVGITNLAEQLKTKLGGLTQAQRDQTLAQIFGTDAIRAANVLYKQGGAGIQDWINKTNDAGYASKTAADLTNNLSGDIERLKGSVETLAISSGSGANGGLRVLVKSLDGLVGQFLAMPPAVGGTLTVLAAVGGASLLALAAFVKVRKGLAEAVLQLEAMGPAGEKAATGLQKTASAAGKTAVAFAALEATAAILGEFGRKAADVDRLTASLTNLANTGKVSGEAADKFGKNLDGIGDDAGVATSGVAKWLDKIAGGIPIIGDAARSAVALGARLAGKDDYQTAQQNFANLDTALTNYMTTAGDAKKASELWNQVLAKSGLDTEQLAKLMPNAYKEVGALNQAQMDAAKSGKAQGAGALAAADGTKAAGAASAAAAEDTKKYTTAAQAAAGAAKGQRIALGQLSDFMKAEADPVFGLIKAESDLKAAQDKATKAIKEHGRNSKEAKAATQDFTLAAIELQGAVGNVAQGFNGKLSPALVNTLKKAGASKAEIHNLEQQFKDAKKAADKYSGNYVAKATAPGAVTAKQQMADAWAQAKGFEGNYQAKLTVSGDKQVNAKLADLLIKQRALASGLSYGAARSAVQKDLDRNRQKGYDGGGWTGPGDMYDVAGVVHADEHVIRKPSRRRLEAAKPGALDYMNETGNWPGYVLGGHATFPFPTNVSKTKIPPMFLPGPSGGGMTYKWIEAVVHAAFPGMRVISDYRPGAMTLTGNKSYHGFGRAVDWPPSKPLAEWFNTKYFSQIKELITPWQSLNIQNGHRHSYSPIVFNEHSFAGGNAHDHVAFARGGTIREPIFGVGASGRTYSFGENYQPEQVIPNWQGPGAGGGSQVTNVNLTVNASVGSHPREIGAEVLNYIGSYLQGGGELRVNGQKVL